MSLGLPGRIGIVAVAFGALAAAVVIWRFHFFLAPFSWTREPERLAQALALGPGMSVADIGAGSGALAVAIAPFVAESGTVYATELTAERRAEIDRRARLAGVDYVRVIAAAEDGTRLPDACCDAIYMRAVFHHIGPSRAFAADVARALRQGGRVAVIDFAPGSLWFHGSDHGVHAESVIAAFEGAGLRLRARDDRWGGGMFLLVFERNVDPGRPEPSA